MHWMLVQDPLHFVSGASAPADILRTVIYYSSGLIKYHWQYPGAVLLGPVPT